MSMLSRILGVGALGIALVGGLAACSPSEDATATGEDGLVVLHRGNGAEPATLDPHGASGTWENNIIGDLFLGLYTEDIHGEPTLGAAEDHQVSEDGLTHTFTIRDGLTWSDGTPVTAYDFEYSLRRIIDPNTAARYAFIVYILQNAEQLNGDPDGDLTTLGARAIDERTLELTLTRPAPFLPYLLTHYTMFAVPQHVVEEHGNQWTRPENMVTNGAYTLQDWNPNDRIVLEKNEEFYDAENVTIDQVVFYPTDDESSALRRFRAGELDMNTGFPSQQYRWLQENMPEETRVYPYFSTAYVLFNNHFEPFRDHNVRRALAMAVDRDTITDVILANGQVPTYSLNPPQMPDYTPPQVAYADMPLEERREEARRLMREAGYGPDNPLSFTYRYMEGNDARRIAVALQGWWEQVYADVDIVNTEPAVHYRDLQTSNYEMGSAGWIADYPDPENYLLLFDSQAGALNYSNYNNPEFEALLREAQATADQEERAALYHAAEEIMLNDDPFIPTYNSVSRTLVGQHVQGYQDNAVHIHRTRWMSIDESQRPEQRGLFN